MTEEEWLYLSRDFTVLNLKRGEFLVREGEFCRHVAFVNSGMIRAFIAADGKEYIQGFINEGEYISEYASFLTGRPANMHMDALEDSELILLSRESMQAGYEQFPVFERMGRKVAEELFIYFNDRNISLLTQSPEERYRRLLENEAYLLQKVPQYMIASYLGVTPEHLSRIRGKMRKA